MTPLPDTARLPAGAGAGIARSAKIRQERARTGGCCFSGAPQRNVGISLRADGGSESSRLKQRDNDYANDDHANRINQFLHERLPMKPFRNAITLDFP
jgi:hypothetical protein